MSSQGGGGVRIMDLDQYLEKMITNTEIIWIRVPTPGILSLKLHNLEVKVQVLCYF